MLARAITRHKAKLRADFQEYYHLNLDGLGREYRIGHAADLVAELPYESRVKTAERQIIASTIPQQQQGQNEMPVDELMAEFARIREEAKRV